MWGGAQAQALTPNPNLCCIWVFDHLCGYLFVFRQACWQEEGQHYQLGGGQALTPNPNLCRIWVDQHCDSIVRLFDLCAGKPAGKKKGGKKGEKEGGKKSGEKKAKGEGKKGGKKGKDPTVSCTPSFTNAASDCVLGGNPMALVYTRRGVY
jgi:hypothetical protein